MINITPGRWVRTFEESPKPLLRLMAFSIPWFWGFIFIIWPSREWPEWTYDLLFPPEKDLELMLAAPVLWWIELCILCLASLILLWLISFAITGKVYTVNFSFLFFCFLALSLGVIAVLFFAPLTEAIGSPQIGTRLFGALIIVFEVFGIIFTLRDILNLFSGR
jgi:hypothetical protein